MCVRAWDPETETLVELRDAEEAERWGVGTQSAFVWVAILVLCRVMCVCECVCAFVCVCLCVRAWDPETETLVELRDAEEAERWGVGTQSAFVWVAILVLCRVMCV